MEWYYVVNKKKMGPVTRDDLAQRVATGDLQPQTLVWHTGASGWKPWSAFAAGSAAAGSQGTAPLPGGPTATSLIADQLRLTSGDALDVMRAFVGDPLGNMAASCEKLGQSRSLGVGLVFGAIFALCVTAEISEVLSKFGIRSSLGQGILFLNGFVQFLTVALAIAAVRFFLRGQGAIGFDVFIAGAAVLPWGGVFLAARVLGLGNFEILGAAVLFALCLSILVLYVGATRILKIPERIAVIVVPLTIIVSAWFLSIIYRAFI